MNKPAALIEVRTTHADGARESVIVPAAQAGVAYRAALRKAWRAKAGSLVQLFAAR